MYPEITSLIKTFESNTKNKKEKYKEFLAHVYMNFDKKISLCNKDNIVNKYKRMRNGIIKFIISYEKQIIKELNK
jgi:hypothetical protein